MKLIEFNQIESIVKKLKREKKNIVFTNGCFDIIHAGHVQYLSEARDLGDVLIIGLNSDESVQRLKGKTRPVISQTDRATVLSALESVSYIIIFDEDTPYNLIQKIKPDILVKGGDWQPKDIVGSDIVLANNGIVKSLSFKDGISTTEIIDRIKKAY